VNSPKFGCRILHSPFPTRPETPYGTRPAEPLGHKMLWERIFMRRGEWDGK
jgi:hypothetical protein